MADPQVLLHKKRKLEGKSMKEGVVSKVLRRGGINLEPPFPEGEDENTMKLHREVLKKEWKKNVPDLEKIKTRMALTYPDRRRLVNGKSSLPEIKLEFPALFCYSEVKYLYWGT